MSVFNNIIENDLDYQKSLNEQLLEKIRELKQENQELKNEIQELNNKIWERK